MNQETNTATSVLYNANCPVCSFEIDHYADYSRSRGLPIVFDDLNEIEKLTRWNVDADTAARRLHVLKDGKLLTGIPAFVALWQDMPRYRWLARFASFPGINWLANKVYDLALAPAIYRWHVRRVRRKTATS